MENMENKPNNLSTRYHYLKVIFSDTYIVIIFMYSIYYSNLEKWGMQSEGRGEMKRRI
jgi:hypothetical protein